MKKRMIILSVVFCSLVVGVLAFTPHVTCGCGQVEEGTKLTMIINEVSQKITGKKIFQHNHRPLE
jgi:hypothetical protein